MDLTEDPGLPGYSRESESSCRGSMSQGESVRVGGRVRTALRGSHGLQCPSTDGHAAPARWPAQYPSLFLSFVDL